MSATVVDASAIAAVLFDEPEAAPILASVGKTLLAPSLLGYELASVCTSKLQRHPKEARLILSRYHLLPGLNIAYSEPDWRHLPILARQWGLSACDAAYLQLSLARKAPLVTLDVQLAAAYDKATRSV